MLHNYSIVTVQNYLYSSSYTFECMPCLFLPAFSHATSKALRVILHPLHCKVCGSSSSSNPQMVAEKGREEWVMCYHHHHYKEMPKRKQQQKFLLKNCFFWSDLFKRWWELSSCSCFCFTLIPPNITEASIMHVLKSHTPFLQSKAGRRKLMLWFCFGIFLHCQFISHHQMDLLWTFLFSQCRQS